MYFNKKKFSPLQDWQNVQQEVNDELFLIEVECNVSNIESKPIIAHDYNYFHNEFENTIDENIFEDSNMCDPTSSPCNCAISDITDETDTSIPFCSQSFSSRIAE